MGLAVGFFAVTPSAAAAGWSGWVGVHLHWASSGEGSSITHSERALYYFDGTTTPGGAAGPTVWDQPTTWAASYSVVATGGTECGPGTATKTGEGRGLGIGTVRFDEVTAGWRFQLAAQGVSGPDGTFPTSQTHPCGPSPGPEEPPFQVDTLPIPLPAGQTAAETTELEGTKTRTGVTFCCDQVDYAWHLTRDPEPPACSNGRDDDNDGLTDFSNGSELGDPNCSSPDDETEGPGADDPWDPLVTIAGDQLTAASADTTRGYFSHLRDLVCASARSSRAACDAIRPAFDPAQWATDGVGCVAADPACWIFNVFDDTLRAPIDPAAEQASIQASARNRFFLSCLLAGRNPYACVVLSRSAAIDRIYARTLHFLDGLEDAAGDVTRTVVETRKRDIAAVDAALDVLRSLHEKFVQAAVLPSYDVAATAGLPAWAAGIGRDAGPPSARCYRETAIHQAFADAYGGYGDFLYRQVSDPAEESIYDNPLCRALE